MKRMDDINFDLEEIMSSLMERKDVDQVLGMYRSLSKYPANKELYEDETSPSLFYNGQRIVETSTTPKLNKLIKECVKHDLQWGEILFNVYEYLHIHCKDVEIMRCQ